MGRPTVHLKLNESVHSGGMSESALFVHLRDCCATFAPGTQTAEQLRTIARKVHATNSERLNAPLKQKCGVSFDEFIQQGGGVSSSA